MTSPYSPDDDVDLGEVARDDALVEALLSGRPTDDDAALDALSALLADVSRDLPEPGVLAPRSVSTAVVPLRRRTGPRVAVAAVAALGVLSAGGVAAAAPGSALRPVRDAVSSAVSDASGAVQDAVDAVTPGRARPSSPAPVSPSPSPSPSPRGARSSDPQPRSTLPAVVQARIAAVQVVSHLDRAERALDDGRLAAARAQLAAAVRLLPSVTPADARARLQARADALRARLAAAGPSATPSETPSASASPSPDRPPRASRGPSPSVSASPSPGAAKSPKPRPRRSSRAEQSSPQPERTARDTASPEATTATPRARPTRTPPGLAPRTVRSTTGR